MSSEQTDSQQEERRAFWDWWNKDGYKTVDLDGPLMAIWLAGIEWGRANERSMHDTARGMSNQHAQ